MRLFATCDSSVNVLYEAVIYISAAFSVLHIAKLDRSLVLSMSRTSSLHDEIKSPNAAILVNNIYVIFFILLSPIIKMLLLHRLYTSFVEDNIHYLQKDFQGQHI